RLIRNSCSSAGTPSRTLSRARLVWPSRTAYARGGRRNKCSLSLREAKSTGPKFFVVTLPSAVIAKVATTNGRLRIWERVLCRDRRDPKVPSTFFFLLREFFFHGG